MDQDDAVRDVLDDGRPQRRLTRRRRVGAAVVLAVALVAAVAVLPRLGDPPAKLARLLSDQDAGYMDVQYDGPSASAATLRDCEGSSCTFAVLLTGDGWDGHVAHLLPGSAGNVWMRLMPDGAVAVVQESGGEPFVLSPDGSTSPLDVSTEPVPDGSGAVLVNGPPLADDSIAWSDVWALNAGDRSLRPLAEQPPRPLIGRVGSPTPGMTVAPISTRTDTLGLQVAVTTDDGRSWTTRPGPAPDERGLPRMDVGNDGHVAVTFVGDGATIGPFEQLFLSNDYGETWREVPAEHRPGTIGGVAFAPDGRLLIADDMDPQLWRLTADRTDLQKVGGDVPPMRWLWSSGGMLAGQTGGRNLAVSDDGRTWRSVTPGLP